RAMESIRTPVFRRRAGLRRRYLRRISPCRCTGMYRAAEPMAPCTGLFTLEVLRHSCPRTLGNFRQQSTETSSTTYAAFRRPREIRVHNRAVRQLGDSAIDLID